MTQLDTCLDTLHLALDNFVVVVVVLTTHPLHLAYFLYFSPYLLPLLSFLLPLLLPTSLLLLLLVDLDDPNPSTMLLDYVFEWDFEAMPKLYIDNARSNCVSDDVFFDCSEKDLPVVEKVPSVLTESPSTRREREWKRTLACKLYEERMTFRLCEDRTVVEGAEEMDLLWEAYEADATNAVKFTKEECEDGEEEDEEEDTVHLCCLQALRMSTGKMNFGVKRPSLEKLSKAVRGIGFFRRSGRRSRKG